MSIISAGTTTTTAFKVTGDTTGSLVLKTGASGLTAVDIDASQVVTIGNIAVTGGTINNTVIGGTTAAAGTFTTLSAASTVTFNGGTANGVAYLNGSKNLTTGSALTFDGTTLANINSDGTGFSTQSAASNFSIMRFGTDSVNGYAFFQSGKSGTGTTLPFAWRQDSSELMRLTSTGLGITVGNAPTQALNLYRTGSTQTVMAVGNSNTGLNGTYFGVDTTGNGIVNTTGAFATIFSNNGSERARITSAGNFGIGTTNPQARLDIVGDATPAGSGLAFGHANTAGYKWIQSFASQPLYINPLGNNVIFNRDGGNVGIGTTSPSYKLHVKGSGSYDGVIFADNSSATGSGIFGIGVNGTRVGFLSTTGSALGDTSQDIAIFNETNNGIRLYTNSAERVRITAGGDFGIGTSSPAQKLDVNGDALINGLRVGRGANSLSANTALGISALAAITSGNSNTAVGYLAADAMTSGVFNCAFGANALGSMTTGSGNCAFGEGALLAATTGQANTAFGGYTGSAEAAGRFLTTGSYNTLIGQRAGANMSTGNENTIIGRYDANQANLDIRTASNYVVVSDGAGNPHYYAKATTGYGSNSPNAYIRGTLNWGTSGAELTSGVHASKVISADNNAVVTVRLKITASGSEWQPGYVFVRVSSTNADATGGASAWYLCNYRMYNGGIGGFNVSSSGGNTGSFTLSVTDAGSGATSYGLLQVTVTGGNNRTVMDAECVNYNLIIDGTRA